jgi:hypothetical protein
MKENMFCNSKKRILSIYLFFVIPLALHFKDDL